MKLAHHLLFFMSIVGLFILTGCRLTISGPDEPPRPTVVSEAVRPTSTPTAAPAGPPTATPQPTQPPTVAPAAEADEPASPTPAEPADPVESADQPTEPPPAPTATATSEPPPPTSAPALQSLAVNLLPVAGGYVYRGSQFPALSGVYFYGDYCRGTVWGLRRAAAGQWEQAELLQSGVSITSFGQDEAGEVYLVAQQGDIFQLGQP